MPSATDRSANRESRGTGERGSILIVVLLLTVTFSVLSLALLYTAEMSLRVQGNAQDLEAAERAARSGVEWAAAMVKTSGVADVSRTTKLDTGRVVRAQVRAATAPQLLGTGDASGVVSVVGADVSVAPGPFPHALLSFSDTTPVGHEFTINGNAYFGGSPPLEWRGFPLLMNGNLDLVTSTTLPAGRVVHTTGATNYGVTAFTEPPWNTTAFTLGGWGVPVTVYNGSTRIRGQTIEGIVVVNLLVGQLLEIEESTIRGTIVVPAVYPPLLEVLTLASIEIDKLSTIEGGTAETGNLAILAPTCELMMTGGNTITGVTFVRSAELDTDTLRGQLLLRKGIEKIQGTPTIERPANFIPTVPHGITWTGAGEVRMTWKGQQ